MASGFRAQDLSPTDPDDLGLFTQFKFACRRVLSGAEGRRLLLP